MAAIPQSLDSEELLHLAINASQEGKTEQAIDYLKRSLELSPENGRALYLLGSLHAELGMYERATDEMEKAIVFEPELDIAHFQLGQLYVTLAEVDKAKKAWEKLDHLNDDNYLCLFKEGIITLLNEDFDGCIEKLKQGIMNNDINLPLNSDMLKMIQAVEKAKNMQAPEAAKGLSNTTGEQIVLSAYNNPDS